MGSLIYLVYYNIYFSGTHILSVWFCPSGWFEELFYYFSITFVYCVLRSIILFLFVRYCIYIYIVQFLSI